MLARVRWALIFVALSLSACGDGGLCSDAPLNNTCLHVDGRWKLEAGLRDSRCGASLFDDVLIIESPGKGRLAGWASSARLFGKLYPAGVFELSSSSYGFEVQGELVQAQGVPDELRGGVTFTEDLVPLTQPGGGPGRHFSVRLCHRFLRGSRQ
jgi:hypothetical protein